MADVNVSEAINVADIVELLSATLHVNVSETVNVTDVFAITLVYCVNASNLIQIADTLGVTPLLVPVSVSETVEIIEVFELYNPNPYFATLVSYPDIDKIYLVEIRAGREIEGETWIASSGAYYCAFNCALYGEVMRVIENGVPYALAASIGDCQSTPSTFFYDFDNKLLYIHMVDNDSPDTLSGAVYKYCLIANFWMCFTNRQPEDDRVIYAPQGLAHEVYYLPYFSETSLPTITQGVGEYYIGDQTMQFGDLTFNNDGYFYWVFESTIWHNAKIYVKMGAKGLIYDRFETVFVGTVRNPKVKDESASITVKDFRASMLGEVPTTIFLLDTYPDLEDSAVGQPIPIPFGRCEGIIPVCVDIAWWIYKVSAYTINAVLAVYLADILLTLNADYTVNLTDATITLLIDPGTMLLTCDIEGVLCSQAGAYSENFSDFVWWMLTELKSIDSSDIDSVAFTALKSERNQHGGYYLNSFMQTLDLMRIFQASALFQLIPLLNGRWTVKYYTTGSTGAPILYKDDLHDLGIEYATDGVFMGVIVGYKKDCATGEYQKVMVFDEKIYYRYGEVGILEVESALYLKAETEALAAFFLNLVKVPPKRIDGEIGPIGFNKNPTDKIIFNKTITDGDGNEVTVFADSVYRILEFRKNLTPVTTGFMGVDDSISLGSFHADSPYEDSHGDAYTDTAHGDVVHADNVHEDAAHQDVPHVDIAHTDTHVDAHADGHADYADRVHIDWHQDAYYDTHSDIPHQDSHTDSYGDTPHGDTIHTDTPYYESYSDYHSDIGHSDAYY